MIPHTWTTSMMRYVHRPKVNIAVKLGKQRRAGFDSNIGEYCYDQFFSCLASHFEGKYTNKVVSCQQELQKLYSSNCALSRQHDARLIISTMDDTTRVNKDPEIREIHVHRFDHTFFAMVLSRVLRTSGESTYEFEVLIDNLAYCRIHSAEFTLGCVVAEIQNLILSTKV